MTIPSTRSISREQLHTAVRDLADSANASGHYPEAIVLHGLALSARRDQLLSLSDLVFSHFSGRIRNMPPRDPEHALLLSGRPPESVLTAEEWDEVTRCI